jgi:hypothetical protein
MFCLGSYRGLDLNPTPLLSLTQSNQGYQELYSQ